MWLSSGVFSLPGDRRWDSRPQQLHQIWVSGFLAALYLSSIQEPALWEDGLAVLLWRLHPAQSPSRPALLLLCWAGLGFPGYYLPPSGSQLRTGSSSCSPYLCLSKHRHRPFGFITLVLFICIIQWSEEKIQVPISSFYLVLNTPRVISWPQGVVNTYVNSLRITLGKARLLTFFTPEALCK